MRLASIQVRDVRSILAADLDPGPIMNLLIGPNGSGKTSLLEAIHFLSLGRSFRTRRARAVIRRGSETLTVFGRVQDEEGAEDCAIGIEKGVNHTRFRIDGEEVRSVSRLARRLPVMVISPEGLKALLEGSEHRRRILDWTLFHVEQGYLQVLQRYEHVLRQRNAILRTPWSREVDRELGIWDQQLATYGEQLDEVRRRHIESPGMADIADKMAQSVLTERVTWNYWSGWERERDLHDVLVAQRDRDRQAGFTRAGPHRADIVWRGTHGMARENLSRGQGRLLVMAFETAQVAYVKRVERLRPILLVDDLSTELDPVSVQRFFSLIDALDLQVFVTSVLETITTFARSTTTTRLFHVKQGEVHSAQ